MFDKNTILFINNNRTLVSIVIFLFLFICIFYAKPKFLFDKNDAPRKFGLGYRHTTVLPFWLIVIIFSIFSYFIVTYFTSIYNIKF